MKAHDISELIDFAPQADGSVMPIPKALDSVPARIAGLVNGCHHKQPHELTELETVAMALFGGAEMEFTPTGIRAKNPIGLQKINDKWIVCEGRALRRCARTGA